MSALFPVSQRNNKKLVFEGFIYSMHRGDEHKTSWRCERFQKGCRGRAVSQGETVIVTQPHNDHLPCTQKCERAVFDGRVRTAARGTHDAPRAVVNECLVGVSDATIAIIPKIVNIEQKVSRARKRQRDQHAPIPHNLASIVIPESLRATRTAVSEDFLMADTGADDAERIIIFASRTDLARLMQCSIWLADATFKVSPEMYAQLWVIHGMYENRVLPFVYSLLPNKRESTYTRALQLILDGIDACGEANSRPTAVIIDFEKAEENAFRKCIPGALIHGCFFHFTQAIWRKIQNLGMHLRYGTDANYNQMLKKFTALAFCSKTDVAARYAIIAAQLIGEFGNIEQHQDFLEYFENIWIGRAHRTPRFSPEMWNCKEVTENLLPRTNNSVESWHNALQSTLGCHHPTIFKLLDGLLKEQVRVNALFVKLQAGDQVPLYSRREYQLANQRLLNIIDKYDQRDEQDYLAACAHYITH
jgi:hypothetical protein